MRLVLAEDHALLRDGLIRILEAHDFTILAAVDNAPELEAALADPEAEAAVLDVRLPTVLHRRGPAGRDHLTSAAAGLPGDRALAVRRAPLRP